VSKKFQPIFLKKRTTDNLVVLERGGNGAVEIPECLYPSSNGAVNMNFTCDIEFKIFYNQGGWLQDRLAGHSEVYSPPTEE
jgi:hypothetical protein